MKKRLYNPDIDLGKGQAITEALKILDDGIIEFGRDEKVVAALHIMKSRVNALVPASFKKPAEGEENNHLGIRSRV